MVSRIRERDEQLSYENIERFRGSYFFEALRPFVGEAEAARILLINYEFHEGGPGSSDIVSGSVDVGNRDRVDAGLKLAAGGSS